MVKIPYSLEREHKMTYFLGLSELSFCLSLFPRLSPSFYYSSLFLFFFISLFTFFFPFFFTLVDSDKENHWSRENGGQEQRDRNRCRHRERDSSRREERWET